MPRDLCLKDLSCFDLKLKRAGLAGSLMAMPRLAGRATGGPRAFVEVLVPVVAQGRLEHLALLGVMAGSATDPANGRSRKDGG